MVKQRGQLQKGLERLLEMGGLQRSGVVVAIAMCMEARGRGGRSEMGGVGRSGVFCRDDGRHGAGGCGAA